MGNEFFTCEAILVNITEFNSNLRIFTPKKTSKIYGNLLLYNKLKTENFKPS